MVVSKNEGEVIKITVDGRIIEQVSSFKYLGSVISEDGRSNKEVITRIALAKEAFNRRRELLTKSWNRGLKKRMVKILVWSVVLYGCETWTLLQADIGKLQALEMWLWRGMEKVSWTDKISNCDVLARVDEGRGLMRTLYQRKKNWIGHVLRGDGLLKEVLEGRMLGKKQQGRARKKMLDDLMEDSDEGKRTRQKKKDESKTKKGDFQMGLEENKFAKLKRRAGDREGWRDWVPVTCLRAEYL